MHTPATVTSHRPIRRYSKIKSHENNDYTIVDEMTAAAGAGTFRNHCNKFRACRDGIIMGNRCQFDISPSRFVHCRLMTPVVVYIIESFQLKHKRCKSTISYRRIARSDRQGASRRRRWQYLCIFVYTIYVYYSYVCCGVINERTAYRLSIRIVIPCVRVYVINYKRGVARKGERPRYITFLIWNIWIRCGNVTRTLCKYFSFAFGQ